MKIPKKAKIPIGVVWAFFVGVVFITPAIASSDMPLEFDCDCGIEIIGMPELNVPFEVVFTWTPRSDFDHTNNISDSARLKCDMDYVHYMSGDTVWTGYLKEDQTYELRAIYKITKPGDFRFKSLILAQQAKSVSFRPAGNPGQGLKAFKGCHTPLIKIDDAPKLPPKNISWIRTESGDSVSIQPFSSEKLNFGLAPVTVKASGMTPLIGEVGPRRINDADTIIVRILRASILEHLPLALSSLRIYRIIGPDDVSSIEIDTACVANLLKISNNAVIIDRPKKECTLNLIMNDSLYQLPIEIVR